MQVFDSEYKVSIASQYKYKWYGSILETLNIKTGFVQHILNSTVIFYHSFITEPPNLFIILSNCTIFVHIFKFLRDNLPLFILLVLGLASV